MKILPKALSVLSATLVVAGLALFGWNDLTLNRPLQQLLHANARDMGFEARAHYGHYVMPGTLVFDVRHLGKMTNPDDVFGVLVQFAQAQRSRRFTFVELAYEGTTKFFLDGDYFHRLGVEYADRLPTFSKRSLAANLYTPDGVLAFHAATVEALEAFGAHETMFDEAMGQWLDPLYESMFAEDQHPPPAPGK